MDVPPPIRCRGLADGYRDRRRVAGRRDQARHRARPQRLASLDTLIARHAAAGLRVSIETSGPPPRSLGAAADQAAYRILQEALTNAARHGAGRARIVLAFGDDTVELMITNPLRVSAAPRSGGHGLIGMQERVTLLGGSLDTEQVNGAFRIRARLPYGGNRP